MMIFPLFTNQAQMHFRLEMRIKHKVKPLQETKTIFNELKKYPKSVLFSIDELDTKSLKKLKK